MAPGKNSSVEDPVTAEYDVYITSPLNTDSTEGEQQQLHLLQYPTRDRQRPYNAYTKTLPLELRMKPLSGFVELDVPISTKSCYDENKAQVWGSALKKAKMEGNPGFGMAAGFGNTPGGRRNTARATQDLTEDYEEDEDVSMQTQTLGGQIMKDEKGKPFYMVGTFRGNELHLTKLAGVVQMRPQFHHIDAKTQVERSRARRDREAVDPPRPVEARIVQMMVKSVDSDNSIDTSSTKEFLQAAQDEPWTRMHFRDEEEDEAYSIYHSKLFVEDTSNAPALSSSMSNDEYLDAISGPRYDPSGRLRHKPHPRRPKGSVEISDGSDHEENRASG